MSSTSQPASSRTSQDCVSPLTNHSTRTMTSHVHTSSLTSHACSSPLTSHPANTIDQPCLHLTPQPTRHQAWIMTSHACTSTLTSHPANTNDQSCQYLTPDQSSSQHQWPVVPAPHPWLAIQQTPMTSHACTLPLTSHTVNKHDQSCQYLTPDQSSS